MNDRVLDHECKDHRLIRIDREVSEWSIGI